MENSYLLHLSDPLRRQIAVGYVQHELRKLFPNLRTLEAWQAIDNDVSQWFSGNPELMPVRDFWNGFQAIAAGFKLKNLLPWLTSQNIIWSQEELPISQLYFGNHFSALDHFSDHPSGAEVQQWYFQPEQAEVLTQAQTTLQNYSNSTFPRDNFFIMAVEEKNQLRAIDGNRQLLKIILEQKQTVSVMVARVARQPMFFETWVPTSILLELVWLHQREFSLLGKTTKAIARSIFLLIKDSQAGQAEFFNRCLGQGLADKTLARAVKKLL